MRQDLTIASAHMPLIGARTADRFAAAPEFVLHHEGDLKICYAPFDHIETKARLVIVGITPGMGQARAAFAATHRALIRGNSLEAALAEAKLEASFSGSMRGNLVAMLDAVGVNAHLNVASTSALFAPGSRAIHMTSALRYPVFFRGKNYSGTPSMLRQPALRAMVDSHLVEEVQALPNALWLPLGPKVEEALNHLAGRGHLDPSRIIAGMPHPSGLNAERIAVFLGRKDPASVSRQTNPTKLLDSFARLKSRFGQKPEGACA